MNILYIVLFFAVALLIAEMVQRRRRAAALEALLESFGEIVTTLATARMVAEKYRERNRSLVHQVIQLSAKLRSATLGKALDLTLGSVPHSRN